MSQTLESLSRELNVFVADIQDEKVTVRTKALEKIQYVIDSRPEEITKLLSLTYFNNQPSWSDLYIALTRAIQSQATRLDKSRNAANLSSQENKNRDYINAIQKLVQLANSSAIQIQFSVIIESAIQCFKEKYIRKYFDLCFLQIVKKHVLCSKGNLADIKPVEWNSKYYFQYTIC